MERKRKKPLEWSRRAAEQLLEIENYIAQDDPMVAASVVDRIIATTAKLSVFPLAGRAGRLRGTRELVTTHYPYTIIYRVRRATVQIIRVVHQARKFP